MARRGACSGWRWILAAAGIAALVMLIRRLGAATLGTQLTAVLPVLPWLLLITAGKYPLQTAGWRLALRPPDRPPWWRSMGATLAGDAVGYLTFAGPVTGEPARALLLRRHLPMPVGIAVGAFERAIYAATGALVVASAFAVIAVRMNSRPAAIAAVLLPATGIALLVGVRSRRRAAAAVAPSSWRGVLSDVWRTRPLAVAAMVAFGVVEHALLGVEAAIVLDALGVEPMFGLIVVLEGLTKILNSAGSVVPGRLGVTETGTALLTAGLGVGASLGLSLALVRRARAVIWSTVGILLLLVLEPPWRCSEGGDR